jgi:lipopolysaccharide export system permease protein
VLGFTAVLTLLLAWLSLQLAPAASSRMLDQQREALRAGQFAPNAPGKFSTFGGGSTVVYAQAADEDGTLRKVFVQRTRGKQVEIALAQRATHTYSEGGDVQVITLYDGERYEGIPGERKFRIVRFAENSIPVRLPPVNGGETAVRSLSTGALLASSDVEHRAELHWRIALPIMALIMALIAVPLARLAPRQGRYARVGYAVLIFFVYINLMIAGKTWIEKDRMPEWLGMWWVHGVVMALALSILFLPRALSRLRYRRNMARRLVAA